MRKRMKVHEKFYGQAMREIESGIKRDDMWAKALALSAGDMKTAKALYVDLLAKFFSDSSSELDKKMRNKAAIKAAHKTWDIFSVFAARSLIWFILISILIAISSSIAIYLHESFKTNFVNNYIPSEESLQPYYKAIVARETGVSNNEIPAEVMDAISLSPLELNLAYGDQASNMMESVADATLIHFRISISASGYEAAIQKNPLPWLSLALISLIFFIIITLAVVKYPFKKS